MQTQPARPPGIPSPPRTPSKHKRASGRGREGKCHHDEVTWLVAEMHLAQKAYGLNKSTPPELLQADHMLHRQEVLKWEKLGVTLERHKVDDKPVNVVSWDGFHECKKELDSLEIVRAFGDLRCPHRHIGEQVRARIISSPVVRHQVMMYIEDIHGAALPLTVVFPNKAVSVTGMTDGMGKAISPVEAYYKCLFSVGQNIAVREPLVKFGVQGEYAMQVDKISDIVLLPSASVDGDCGDWRYPVQKAGQDIFNAVEMDYDAALRMGRNEIEIGKQYDASFSSSGDIANIKRAITTFTKALANPTTTQDALQRATILLERSQAFNFAFKCGPAFRDAREAFGLFDAAQDITNTCHATFSLALAA
ncbi:hypothetical protein IAT38_007090 [Cryptococcus sp. DSM 104549]